MKIYFKHEKSFIKEDKILCEAYCIPENETDEDLLNKGWLPSMEEKNVWYQSRSCRLNVDNLKQSKRRINTINKLDTNFFKYEKNIKIDNFFKQYYLRKQFNIFNFYENCSDFFDVSVVEVSYKEDVVAYARFTERANSNIFLDLSYTEKFSKFSLGTNLYFILANYTKKQNKKYLYIFESYKNLYEYKENFTNVEIWDGLKWV